MKTQRGQNNCPSDVDKLTAQGSPANGYGLFPVGSPMVTGQSCGSEGEFAQVVTFDDSVSSPDDIADSLGKLGYIDADATLRPINREDYTMEDQFTTNTSSMQGSQHDAMQSGLHTYAGFRMLEGRIGQGYVDRR